MRTTADAVKGIIEVNDAISLDPFIESANALVTEICAPAGYTNERLELIERYLAAHFYTLRDPRATSERAGSAGASYQSSVALFLSTSHYGQHAILLDTKGGLALINKSGAKRPVSVLWLGSSCS